MKLIGLTGYGGVGKDTFADILVEHFGWEKFSFSDELYEQVAEGFMVPKASLYDRTIKETPMSELALINCMSPGFIRAMDQAVRSGEVKPFQIKAPLSPRQVLQWWGTEYRRKEDPDYWLKKSTERLFQSDAHGMVNVSVRFENEAKWVWKNGGINVRIVRNAVKPPNDYISEKGIDDKYVDHTVPNNWSVEDLFELARDVRLLA